MPFSSIPTVIRLIRLTIEIILTISLIALSTYSAVLSCGKVIFLVT